ncbi:MAG: mechanosensitive ion channel family protein [Planctomycetota bacterium]
MRQDETTAEAADTSESAADAGAETGNAVADNAMQTFRDLTDGDVTSTDLLALWTHVGWPITKVILLIIAVLIVSGWVRRLVMGACKKADVEITLSRFLGNVSKWLVMLLGAITILQTFGIEATSFAAVLASVGFAIGLALSGLLGGVAAGVMLLIFRPFKVGDFVRAAGESGTVQEIGLFTTRLTTPDNRMIIVPNGEIFGGNIENVTAMPKRRVDVAVGTDYSADLDKTREVLMSAATAIEGVDADPEPVVYLNELGGSSIDWAVRVWSDTSDYWAVRERLTREIKVRLDEAGIGIPFPQMDVHVDGKLGNGPG